MDKSQEYLKKCMKAEEIQKNWDLKDGDFYTPAKDEAVPSKVCILNDWETRNHIAENRGFFAWIPRLDQLQNMIDWTQWEFKITKKAKIEMRYTNISGEPGSGIVLGESMEQIWLAFVMKEKHGKLWDPENEAWITA